MIRTQDERIKTAEFVSLSFLVFFVVLCLAELLVHRVMHIAFILSTGVLFFSSAAVFGIDEKNLDWQIDSWSKNMKIFMLLFLIFVSIISLDIINIAKKATAGDPKVINNIFKIRA